MYSEVTLFSCCRSMNVDECNVYCHVTTTTIKIQNSWGGYRNSLVLLQGLPLAAISIAWQTSI